MLQPAPCLVLLSGQQLQSSKAGYNTVAIEPYSKLTVVCVLLPEHIVDNINNACTCRDISELCVRVHDASVKALTEA